MKLILLVICIVLEVGVSCHGLDHDNLRISKPQHLKAPNHSPRLIRYIDNNTLVTARSSLENSKGTVPVISTEFSNTSLYNVEDIDREALLTDISRSTCVDKHKFCRVWTFRGYCTHTHVNYVRGQCPKSCGVCGYYRTTDYRCGKSYPGANGQPGQCHPESGIYCCSNWGWCGDSSAHCGCSSCINFREDTCSDWNQWCEYWAGIGECSKNPGYMHKYCRKSCQKCGTADTGSHAEIAKQYAPKLRFDSQQGSGDKCLPSSASDYHNSRKGGNKGRICNLDYNSMRYGRVPTYWKATECGNDLIIAYWTFYGYQGCCFSISWLGICEGSHDVDWEHVYVKVTNFKNSGSRKLGPVQFYQHHGWYTKNAGHYQVEGTHPIVYIGKNSHGSYHDDGGSGGCCYWEDYRNPGGPNKYMNTWLNMKEMKLEASDPNFKEVMYSNYYDSPLERGETSNMCKLKGCSGSSVQTCNTSGCAKSDVGSGSYF